MTLNRDNEAVGLILARYGQQVDVETCDGEIQRIYLHRSLSDIVTGDKVFLKSNPSNVMIVQRLPRTSLLEKPSIGNKSKPIAANIDQLALVIAPQPAPSLALIDDYLVMAELLRIQPIIVFNKLDLLTLQEKQLWQKKLNLYKELPYTVIFMSSLKKSDILKLAKILSQKTNILVGQSGVGKSSIIKQLIPDLSIRIGELSRQGQHGKHTTTTTRLYHLACGGNLIDSPGVRSFTLQPISASKIAACFIEFTPYLPHCRFKNCQHQTEPHCAILESLKKGKIAQTRYNSYQRLIGKSSHHGNLSP